VTRIVPFVGARPTVAADDLIECRNAYGDWVPMVAAGPARYDMVNAAGRFVHLTVPVAVRAEWYVHGANAHTINWPAEDVRIEACDGR
jgi:hypothetical protein